MAESVIGEKVTLEEMGGARMHCSTSGVGDEVRVMRAQTSLRLLMPAQRTFFEVLRRKLKWGQR
jgi:acetyl-CoA carboxylase carboxyltransferase component